jgi:NTP pyrophosphatase (non-canonical NTP hydrolase)
MNEQKSSEAAAGEIANQQRTMSEIDFVVGFIRMQNLVHKTALEHGWWENERNDGECIALMHSELSEALEGLRKPKQDDHCPEFTNVEVELADCIIRIMDLAYARKWRVADALVAKARFNESRPYKHGGKAF